MRHITLKAIRDEAPDIYDRALQLHARMPEEIFEMARLYEGVPGLEVRYDFLDEGILGEIHKKGDNEFIIRVNVDKPKTQQRFTLAHELAHYILHRHEMEGVLRENRMLRGKLSNPQEIEANQLAAEIILPYEKVFQYMESVPGVTLGGMAAHFLVSPDAMAVRLGFPLA